MSRPKASWWISRFNMTTHVEGGSFAEVYRSPLTLPPSVTASAAVRNSATHIYFLLEQGQFSAFHRILSDELWHFYEGDPLVVYEIKKDGTLVEHFLGRGEQQQLFTVIEAGSWFASAPGQNSEYSLVGCTVSPGFDFADFELAKRETLSSLYPQHAARIETLTRD
ncbi:MAG: cupin domain-containing protein [Chitinophagaceae bacterium]|nr:MAG: cupin domain-containing protein [Chitinophagaceae bacterium]